MKTEPVSEALRRALEGCGESRYSIAQATGIQESSLSRFVRGHSGLSLEAVDLLCAHLGLELRPRDGRRAKR